MADANHALLAFLRLPDIAGERCVDLVVNPAAQFINMRGDAADATFLQAVGDVLGQDIPVQPNTTSRGEHVVLWLGPDEWLITTGLDAQALIATLADALAGQFVTFTDLSAGQVILRLSGDSVRDVLCKGCTLDLHPDHFRAGDCAQTTLAKAGMLITRPAEGACFDIVVSRSFAEYAALWLRHAAAEYGFRAAMS